MKLFNFFKQDDQEIAAKIRAATKVRMDDAARERTRALLSEYVKMRPVRDADAVPLVSVPAYRSSFFFIRHSVPAFAAVLVLVGGGTVAAAEGALPGDILYPVKVHVTEEVRAKLATTPKAKADWQVSRAERRLEEAATLALAGKLDDATRVELDTNLDAHVESANESRKQLEEDDAADASKVDTDIQAVLIARENILDGKRAVAAAKAAARPEAATLMMSATAVSEVSADRAGDGDKAEADPSRRSEAEAETKGHRTAAKARIEAAKKFLNRMPVRLSDDARMQVETRLKEAAEAYSSGEVDVSEGNEVEASSHFDSALESATQIEAIVSVSADTDGSENADDNVDGGGSGTSGNASGTTNLGL